MTRNKLLQLLGSFFGWPLLVKKPSPIHGTGIFATRDIEAQETFYYVHQEFLFNKPRERCARLNQNTWICDERVLNYVNHSCNPNTLFVRTLGSVIYPRLRAKRVIEAGEEITVDYNRTEGDDATQVKCNCQAQNCRGYFLRKE